MSLQFGTALNKSYASNVMIQAQQRPGRMRQGVETEPAQGNEHFFDQIDSVEVVTLATRHGDTPQIDTPHNRRRVTPTYHVFADLIDDPDRAKSLADFESPYAVNAAYAMNRAEDQLIIDAIFGTNFTGMDGATSVVFPAANEVAVGFGGGGDVGLTLGKLIELRRLMRTNEADDGDMFMAVGAQQIADLLNIGELQNIDTNVLRPLVAGKVAHFMGFTFIPTELLPLSSGDRRCPAWIRQGLRLAVWEDSFTDISRRRDKNFSTQVYHRQGKGATRTEEKRVFSALCNE